MVCDAGTRSVPDRTACVECAEGTVSARGATNCTECAAGEQPSFDDDGRAVACEPCLESEFSLDGRHCRACPRLDVNGDIVPYEHSRGATCSGGILTLKDCSGTTPGTDHRGDGIAPLHLGARVLPQRLVDDWLRRPPQRLGRLRRVR